MRSIRPARSDPAGPVSARVRRSDLFSNGPFVGTFDLIKPPYMPTMLRLDMGKQTLTDGAIEYQWASDVAFDGIRLEGLTDKGEVLFDVSVPEVGSITVNTFGKEVPADRIMAALKIAQQRR